jgi:hypothetical protein
MLLTKDQIQSAADRPTKLVEVPEWGGDLIVATMDGTLRARYEEYLRVGPGGFEKLRAVIVSLTVVDEAGQPLFTEDDVEWLNKKSGAALDRVFDAAIRLNKLRKADMDELEKNSESGPNAGG